MIHKVAKFIQQKQLMQEGEKVLIALSGGADSVALLMILQKLGYECEAIHCNFHLRGEESMRDEEFVRSLCERKGTELFVVDFDTQKYAEEKGISIEMAARELRYNAFEQHRKKRVFRNCCHLSVFADISAFRFRRTGRREPALQRGF